MSLKTSWKRRRRSSTNGHGKCVAPDNETYHARFPHLNPLDVTTSHSTKLPKTAAKSLVIPQAGEEAIESLREFHVSQRSAQDVSEARICCFSFGVSVCANLTAAMICSRTASEIWPFSPEMSCISA